ncbi:MAG: hypothetical protein K2M65_07560 [Muribaculaceae bacterium]|nr:hypothetical protein [Muribaculaceae bacterium]
MKNPLVFIDTMKYRPSTENDEKLRYWIPARRRCRYNQLQYIDPLTGQYCTGNRLQVLNLCKQCEKVGITVEMFCDETYSVTLRDFDIWHALRCRYEFEYWLVTQV